MSRIRVCWLERTELARVSLRRFTFHSDKRCRASEWGHEASRVIVEDALRHVWVDEQTDDAGQPSYRVRRDLVSLDDPRWPTDCAGCGEPFQLDDEWQVNVHDLYASGPGAPLYTLRETPVGSMWDAWWMSDCFRGPDGIALVVRTPGGEWMVDGQASNCTKNQYQPAGDAAHPTATRFVRSHYCWVRHGDPRTGDVHVDKNGNTCAAGGGSIIAGSYHGFLHHSHLVEC